MKLPWQKKETKNLSLKEPEAWRDILFPSTSSSGAVVNTNTALGVASVYACVKVISETIASLPLKVFETSGEDNHVAPKHPLTRLLGMTPNDEQTAFEMREFQVSNLLLQGNSYSQQVRNGRGAVVKLNPLYSRHMKVGRSNAGKLVFDYQEPGNTRVFSPKDIWRVAGLGADGVTGYSVVSMARETIGLSIAMEQHGGNLFKNGLHTNLFMEYPHAMNDEQFKRLKDYVEENGGVTNTGKPFLLEGGAKMTSIGMSNDDAQFLESRKFSVNEVARWFRVPPHMIGDLEKATFSNIEQQNIDFTVHTIRPWLVRIEQTIMRDLLNRQEQNKYYAQHNVEGLLRGDTISRYQAYALAINNGIMTRNEVRQLENRNSIDGLDEILTPLNMAQDSETPDETQQSSNSVANAVARVEVKALKTEADRLNNDQFKEWVVKYYARFQKKLVDSYGVEPAEASLYVLNHIELFNDGNINEVIAEIEQAAPEQVEKIL